MKKFALLLVRKESYRRRRSNRILGLVAQLLLGLTVAASASAQSVGESAASSTTNLKLDHFWCYIVSSETPQPPVVATLTDQFQTGSVVSVGSPLQFCNPVQKTVGTVITSIVDLTAHLTMYHLETAAALPTPQTLTATNQFGARQFTVDTATTLMVPTQKNTLGFPKLDHYLCYSLPRTPSLDKRVSLTDQFQTQNKVTVEAAELFCNPVEKTIGGETTRILNATAHLLCYNIRLPKSTNATTLSILNQLETDTFTVTSTPLLCVPSTKTVP